MNKTDSLNIKKWARTSLGWLWKKEKNLLTLADSYRNHLHLPSKNKVYIRGFITLRVEWCNVELTTLKFEDGRTKLWPQHPTPPADPVTKVFWFAHSWSSTSSHTQTPLYLGDHQSKAFLTSNFKVHKRVIMAGNYRWMNPRYLECWVDCRKRHGWKKMLLIFLFSDFCFHPISSSGKMWILLSSWIQLSKVWCYTITDTNLASFSEFLQT